MLSAGPFTGLIRICSRPETTMEWQHDSRGLSSRCTLNFTLPYANSLEHSYAPASSALAAISVYFGFGRLPQVGVFGS